MTLPLLGTPCRSHACSACCHDTEMPLTEADRARLSAAGHDPARFAREDDGWLRLANVGGRCHFLDAGGRCGVYEIRPEGCRLYPLVWDPGLRRVVWDEEGCPYTREFVAPSEATAAVEGLVARLTEERRARAGRRGRARPRP
ncbi:MAG: YkgJ family cysteine cluster protein [Methanobacteriota archaeon]